MIQSRQYVIRKNHRPFFLNIAHYYVISNQIEYPKLKTNNASTFNVSHELKLEIIRLLPI